MAVAIGALGLNTNVDAGLSSFVSCFVGVSLGVTLGLNVKGDAGLSLDTSVAVGPPPKINPDGLLKGEDLAESVAA